MAELENEIDGKTAEMPPSDLENYLNKTEKEVENGPNSPSHGGSEAKNHRNFTARLVISPTFDTKTGERNKDIEALEYTCGDCDWKATVHDAGAAGLQLILHTLGIDDLKVEWLDAKNFAESADFDIDNPEEVLKKMRSMAEKAENDAG